MTEEKAKCKTPKEFFASFSEEDKNALYIVDYTTKFKKSVDLCYRRNLNLKLLEKAIKTLSKKGSLPESYSPHPLKGYKIQPDWLLVWLQNDSELILLLTDTGTHSDLF